MKAGIDKSCGFYQVTLRDDRGYRGTLLAKQIHIHPIGSEYLIELLDGRRNIGSVVVADFLNLTEDNLMKPTEISDREKRWMGEMMQAMGMIRRDHHTLD